MLEAFYATERGSLEDITINGDFDLQPDLVWLDLIAPSQEEQQWILDAYEQNLPTLKSLEDISSSARFYRDDDGILHISTYFLTKNKNYQVDGEPEESSGALATVQTVAFILHKERLFTLRGEKLATYLLATLSKLNAVIKLDQKCLSLQVHRVGTFAYQHRPSGPNCPRLADGYGCLRASDRQGSLAQVGSHPPVL